MLPAAALGGDVDAVRRLLSSGCDVNERGTSNDQTSLHIAAYRGDMEVVWTLLDAGADRHLTDAVGATALDLAAQRGHQDVAELLGAPRQETVRAAPADDSDDEAPAAPPPGALAVLDHVLSLNCALPAFEWARYESALAKLGGVPVTSVFVTPEPGVSSLEVRATVVKRLAATDAASPVGIDEVMAAIKALRRQQPLQSASGGAALIGPPKIKLLGEGMEEAAAQVAPRAAALLALRSEYDALKQAFGAASGHQELALLASKAILLLRPERKAMQDAATAAAAAVERRRKRQGGGPR